MTHAALPADVLGLLPQDWLAWGAVGNEEWLGDEGRKAVAWATDVVADFYGDEWYRRNLERGSHPLLSVYDRPTYGPVATMRHIERAARVELLPDDVKATLAAGPNGIRSSCKEEDFDHLDVVLEVLGLASRDGWRVASEVATAGGRLPDVYIDRHDGCGYSIEVTTQGFDARTRRAQEQDEAVSGALRMIEARFRVECTGKTVRLLAEGEIREFITALEKAAARTADEGRPHSVDVSFAWATVYPPGHRPAGTSYEGPHLRQDLWPRFSQRLRSKAEQTEGGRGWIRIEEGGGLLQLTSMYNRSPPERLELLRSATARALADYPHVGGVIVSHGAGPDWTPTRRPANLSTPGGSAYVEQRLPGMRRRQSYILNLDRPGLLLPPRLLLDPARWYRSEDSWLYWATQQLGIPQPTLILSGERRRGLLQ